ncbi:MAG: DUF3179 domain-containing protein, partial [Planctomycetes bacterium]|nr:DUF3179 domain-containing protein [Planctomycetota bacterium]
IALMVMSALLALAGVLILTDAGQLFRIGKKFLVFYFRFHKWIMVLSITLFVVAIFLNTKQNVLQNWMIAIFGAFLAGCFLATKYLAPYMIFRAKQRTAVYKSIPEVEADDYLQSKDTVYVIDYNGVTRAFPQKNLWVSHIFGGDYGGDEVVLTYCVLTNLPVPYVNDLEGKPMELKVLAQTNNNLLLWDTKSGEIIQQITNTCELSRRKLEPLPLVEMTWKAFQELFPDGEVLYNPLRNPMEKLLNKLMPLEVAHSGENWMFKTVDLKDDRLPSKEKVIGIKDGTDAKAYTRDYLVKNGIINTKVGDKSIAIAHIPEHDLFVGFDRMKDGQEIEVTDVDVFGDTREHGRLNRTFIYNGPMWAVWRHFHPDTELFQ